MAYYIEFATGSRHYVHLAAPQEPPRGGALGDGILRRKVDEGERLSEEELSWLPRQAMLYVKKEDEVGDFGVLGPCYVVSEAFRDLIVDLEPGAHQFADLEVLRRDGSPHPKRFFQINILNRVDAIDADKSDVKIRLAKNAYGVPIKKPDGSYADPIMVQTTGSNFVLFKDKIDGLHLWAGEVYLPNRFFFSDALMAAVRGAGLKGIEAFEAKEV